jgi:hypothetical protein
VQLAADGPTSSVRRRSIAMWMSSSPGANAKRRRRARGDRVEPAESSSASAVVMITAAREHLACAFDCAMSCGHRRRSKRSEALIALEVGVLWLVRSATSLGGQSRRAATLPEHGGERLGDARDLPSLSCGKNGSASERAATSSQTGNSRAVAEALAVEAHQVDRRQVGLALRCPRSRSARSSRRGRRPAAAAREDEPAADVSPPASGQGSSSPSIPRAPRGRARRRARAREQLVEAPSCAMPSAQAMSDRR